MYFCSVTRRRSRRSEIGWPAVRGEREAGSGRRKRRKGKRRTVKSSRHRILRGEREREEDHRKEIIPEAQGAG